MTPAADDRLARGWALKEAVYQAFRSAPPRAAEAAQALRALAEAAASSPDGGELAALADWCDGIVCLTEGRMAPAVQAFDRADAGLRAAGRADAAAQTQVPKIMALSMLGQHAEAIACAEATRRELLAHGDALAAARVSQNLGSLHARRDAYPEAARHFREAAVRFARLGDHTHSVLADIGLADALTAMGDTDEALRIYARARMRAGQRGLAMQVALVEESLALLELARGRWRPALAGLEAARAGYEALGLPQYLAIAEKQLGDAYLALRLLPEALALLAAAERQFAALALPDEQAWALAQRGRAEALLGDAAAAGASLDAAAALFQAQGNAVGEAAVRLAQAEWALARPDGDAAQALHLAEQAGAGYARAGLPDGQARAALVRAQALLALDDGEAAQAAFTALLEDAQARAQWALLPPALTGLGRCALAAGDGAQAAGRFEAAIEAFEDQRRALPGDELRSAFLADHLQPYEALLRLALAAGNAEAVLQQLDRCRARALDERLAEGALAPAADDEATTALRERLNWLYRRQRRLQDDGEPGDALTAEIQAAERALLERARRQRLAAAAAAPAATAPAASGHPDIAALQAALADDDALVEYGALDDELFACVVRRGGVRLVRRLARWSAVREALRSARFQIESLSRGAAPLRQHLPMLAARAQARLAQVQALVWAPLAADLQGVARVLLVPHAELGGLPFAALPVPVAGDASGATQPLGQQLQLALAASARAAWRGLQRPPRPARRLLALAESSRLPHAAAEARAVAVLFADAGVLIDAQASLPALRREAPAADVLHLACHAQFRGDNPRFSALHLHDGALTVEAAEALALPACTVVLSACDTGTAEIARGDEQVGLVRAFMVAGAARVLASQWPVDDAVTAQFMAAFHAALAAGQAPAAALQAAQDRSRADHPHPAHWAAFALHGGW